MTGHQDLGTKAGRKAYRHELRMVAVRPRRAGLIMLMLGLLLILLPLADIHSIGGLSPLFLGMVAVALSVPLLVAGVLLRRRYHGRRMRGELP